MDQIRGHFVRLKSVTLPISSAVRPQ